MVLARQSKLTKGKIIHVIRHGESQHNVDFKYLGRRDTTLTEKGQRQAHALRRLLPKLKPKLVITSAVLRALQTTKAMGFKGRTVVVPDAREVASHIANRPIHCNRAVGGDLSTRFGSYDWTLPVEDARKAGGLRGYQQEINGSDKSNASVRARAKQLSKYLQERAESSIALVSHGHFLQFLTGDSYYDNCECRSYRLVGSKWYPLRRWRQKRQPFA